jgi:hypothetical protein
MPKVSTIPIFCTELSIYLIAPKKTDLFTETDFWHYQKVLNSDLREKHQNRKFMEIKLL